MKGLVAAIFASLVLSVTALVSVPMAYSAKATAQPITKPKKVAPTPIPYERPVTPFTVPLESIVKLHCTRAKGAVTGTAEVINGNTLLTASHVVKGATGCTFKRRDGVVVKATVVYDRNDMDYAVLYADTGNLGRIPLNCNGFVTGQTYMMIGYAHGTDFVIQTAVATPDFSNRRDWESGQEFKRVRTLRGTVEGRPSSIGGMSGGPIFNMKGEMVGTVVASPTIDTDPEAFARELRHTYICEARTTPPVNQ